MNDLRPLCSIVYILALDHTKLNRSAIGSHLDGESSTIVRWQSGIAAMQAR
jgi:hypothetical protein